MSKGISLQDLSSLAQCSLFQDYKIIVYSTKNFNLPQAVENEHLGWRGTIYLLLDDTSHLSLITKLNAFFGREGYYCQTCYKFFTGTSASHICDASLCKQCKTAFCGKSSKSDMIRCSECKRGFYGEVCYQRHLKFGASPLIKGKSRTVCDTFIACPLCNRDLKADGTNAYDRGVEGRKHVCFKNKCRTRGQIVDMSTHECFIKSINVKNPYFIARQWKDRGKHWFFDMETMKVFDETKQPFFFVPNFIVLKSEAGKKYVFEGQNALENFCKFCFAGEDSLAHSDTRQTLWAHNNARFDGMFVLQGFCGMMSSDPSLMMEGASPIQIKWKKVCFKDTYKYLMCSLDALAKQFDLSILKGFFPHGFNTPENQDYKGPLPEERFFETKFMTEKWYTEFKKWYDVEQAAIQSGDKPPWDFQQEMRKYCENDVDVLMQAWLLYQQKMFDLTGIFPGGIRDMSAASYTNQVWKSTLDDGTIGVIPVENYVRNDNQSQSAREWLTFEDMFYYAGEMQFSGKGVEGEKRIALGNSFLKVDGFHAPSNTVFEFAGCFYHGCNRCTCPDSRSPLSNVRFRDLNTKFADRIAFMKNRSFKVQVMWECEWNSAKKELETATMLKEIYEYVPDGRPINPQDALFGGRTGASSILFPGRHEIPNETHIVEGLDVVSLYPSVNMYCEYPVGHPRVILGPSDRFEQDPDYYFGLIKCVMLPPKKLFHPVLPYRVPGAGESMKLVFPLCRTCAIHRQRERCEHNERERCLDGTWPSPEIYKALELGYRFLKISTVWDYKTDDGVAKKRAGLFKEFVSKFYKLKAEASGYPSHCKTDEEKEAFLRKFEEVEGIRLDPANMRYDPAARTGAKLQLNSLWGKWAQRLDQRKTIKLFHDSVTLHRFVNNPEYSDFEVRLINAETGIVKGKAVRALQRPNIKGNRVHAAFTTSWARLRLLQFMLILDKRVLYFDTDSIFFRKRVGEVFDLPIGDFLGQLTPVFSGNCIEFVALGPKNYFYRTDEEDKPPCLKVRGLTFNRTSSLVVNADVMRNMVNESVRVNREGSTREKRDRLSPISGFVLDSHAVPRFTMKRGDGPHNPFSVGPREESREYSVVFDKRFVNWESDNLLAFPFGYDFF